MRFERFANRMMEMMCIDMMDVRFGTQKRSLLLSRR